jgi:hypothetical protein
VPEARPRRRRHASPIRGLLVAEETRRRASGGVTELRPIPGWHSRIHLLARGLRLARGTYWDGRGASTEELLPHPPPIDLIGWMPRASGEPGAIQPSPFQPTRRVRVRAERRGGRAAGDVRERPIRKRPLKDPAPRSDHRDSSIRSRDRRRAGTCSSLGRGSLRSGHVAAERIPIA